MRIDHGLVLYSKVRVLVRGWCHEYAGRGAWWSIPCALSLKGSEMKVEGRGREEMCEGWRG